MTNEIWILGAGGRVGSAVAGLLVARGQAVVLVGRSAEKLEVQARTLGGKARVEVADAQSVVKRIEQQKPLVVVNTIGPFTETAVSIASVSAGYVDISNELFSINDVLSLHDQAATRNQCWVTGAGFGLLATEAIVLKLCEGQPPAARVRVDALAAIDSDGGRLGDALAGSIIDGVAAGGWRYHHGKLRRASLASEPAIVELPDGTRLATSSVPTGDLAAAQRASRAPEAVSATGLIPGTFTMRMALRVAVALLAVRPLRNYAKRRLAAVAGPPARRKQDHSWGHARVEWADGTTREGWLRAGEGMAFTAAVTAECAFLIANQKGRPGAYTPGALFGASLAEAVGAEISLR